MSTTPTIRNRHAKGGQGMNWLRPEKRLAIYLRDGLACCYCGSGVEDGVKLTLDHLTPHSQGGTNDEEKEVSELDETLEEGMMVGNTVEEEPLPDSEALELEIN